MTGKYPGKKLATRFDRGNGELHRDGTRRFTHTLLIRAKFSTFALCPLSKNRDMEIAKLLLEERGSFNKSRDNVRQIKVRFLSNERQRTKPCGSASATRGTL